MNNQMTIRTDGMYCQHGVKGDGGVICQNCNPLAGTSFDVSVPQDVLRRISVLGAQVAELKQAWILDIETINSLRNERDLARAGLVSGVSTSVERAPSPKYPHGIQVYVTKTGKIRIHGKDGREWLPGPKVQSKGKS